MPAWKCCLERTHLDCPCGSGLYVTFPSSEPRPGTPARGRDLVLGEGQAFLPQLHLRQTISRRLLFEQTLQGQLELDSSYFRTCERDGADFRPRRVGL